MDLKKIFYPILFLLPVLYIAVITIGGSFHGTDDAQIYFVYMRNIANHYGFVYQTSDGEVEGFTSILWTAMGSLYYKVYAKPHQLFFITNVTLLIICFVQVYDYIKNFLKIKNQSVYVFYIVLVILSPGFIVWNVYSLLETGLWTFLLFTTVLNILKTGKNKYILSFNLLICLLIFTRPESLVLVPFFILWKFIFFYIDNQNFKQSTILLLSSLATFLASIFLLYIWRYTHFDSLFPNTYYAKASGSYFQTIFDGILYDFLFYSENMIYAIILLSAGFFVLKTTKSSVLSKNNVKIYFLFSVLLMSIITPLIGGSDHFGLYRFMQPYIPLFWLLAIQLNYLSKKVFLIAVICLSLLSPQGFFAHLILKKSNPAKVEWAIVQSNKEDAENLNHIFSDINKPSAGVLAAGAFAYYYEGYSIDLLGLNNVKMARADKIKKGPKNHASFNKKVFYEQAPDLIISNVSINPTNEISYENFIEIGEWEAQILKEIQKDEKFRELYGNYIIEDKKTKFTLKAFIKKKFVKNELCNNSRYKITLK